MAGFTVTSTWKVIDDRDAATGEYPVLITVGWMPVALCRIAGAEVFRAIAEVRFPFAQADRA